MTKLYTLIKLAYRSIIRNKVRSFTNIIGIFVGIFFAIFFISFANGFWTSLIDNSINLDGGHIVIESGDYLENDVYNNSFTISTEKIYQISEQGGGEYHQRFIVGDATLQTATGANFVTIKGIESEQERGFELLRETIINGSYFTSSEANEIIITKKVAEELKLRVGSKVVISIASSDSSLESRKAYLKVVGIVGESNFKNYVTIETARTLYNLPENTYTRIGIFLKSPSGSSKVAEALSVEYQNQEFDIFNWEETFISVVEYVELERFFLDIMIYGLIGIIMLSLFNTMLVTVLERKREITRLKIIGTPTIFLQAQIILESIIISSVGLILASICGLAVYFWLRSVGINFDIIANVEPDIGGGTIPTIVYPYISVGKFLFTAFFIYSFSIILSLYPAYKVLTFKIHS